MNTRPRVELFLSRFADAEWRGVVRPWLESGRGVLQRSLVVAPTRGHTHALKRRCVEENLPLLGVEFLTPAGARAKRGGPARLESGFQLLALRGLIEHRIEALGKDDAARRIWRSLSSDLESASADHEDLLKAGFRASDFSRPELSLLFSGLSEWAAAHGFALGPALDEEAALKPPGPGDGRIAERLLILAGGPQGWPEFFGLAALARRCGSVAVSLADPEFVERGPAGEAWTAVWEAFLEVEAKPVDEPDPASTCAGVAELWTDSRGSAERASVIVGRSRSEELERAGAAVHALIENGAQNIAVIFPAPGAAPARFARILRRRNIPFADMIGTVGATAPDVALLRALALFYERGCRMEELLELIPLLQAQGRATITRGAARGLCERLFDESQAHAIEPHVSALEASSDPDSRELGRVARLLLPGLPQAPTLGEAVERFEAAIAAFGLAEPPRWAALREAAARIPEAFPRTAVLEALLEFLPEKGPAGPEDATRTDFARVTLTTCRRAAGVAWSHAVFVLANRGVWPQQRESSCWLDDEERSSLNARSRFSLGLATADQAALLERALYAAIARDTHEGILFTAALANEEEPEVRLGPNGWLERVLWAKGLVGAGRGLLASFEGLAALGGELPPPAAAPAGWAQVWRSRRDPALPFDEHFLAELSGLHRPERLSASQIEDGSEDPATLWFGAVLGVHRIGWRPFARARQKALGTLVHRMLAIALGADAAGADFGPMAGRATAAARLEAELAGLRSRWPAGWYWDSFHLDVSGAAHDLLGQVYELSQPAFVGTEIRVPAGAQIPAGAQGSLAVRGRMDLVVSSGRHWRGSSVEIFDFKTGVPPKLSRRRLASGEGLQPAVYLLAALWAGAAGGASVLAPGKRPSRIDASDLDEAEKRLGLIARHLSTGVYGALTADRGEHSHPFEWPLACAPIGEAVLARKFAATFGPTRDGGNRR